MKFFLLKGRGNTHLYSDLNLSIRLLTADCCLSYKNFQEASAESRSLMISSTFSIPILILINPSVMPNCSRCSLGTPKWVMDAGCESNVSQVPNETVRVQSFRLFIR